MSYYIRYQGRKQGPLTEAQLVTLLSRGTVTKETEASVDETSWRPLGRFPEYDRLYAKIVEQYVKPSASGGSSGPVPPPLPPGAGGPEENIFDIAGFSPEESNQKLDRILQSMASAPVPRLESSLKGNPVHLYVAGGAAAASFLILLLVSVLILGGSPRKTDLQDNHSSMETGGEEWDTQPVSPSSDLSPSEFDHAREDIRKAEEEARREAERKRLVAEAEEKRRREEEKKAEEERRRREIDSALVASTEQLKNFYPPKPSTLGASGEVLKPKTLFSDFQALLPFKEKFQLRYASYVPHGRFSADSVAPHEVIVRFHGESSSPSEIYRFVLDADGLRGEWMETTSITHGNYRQVNGFILGDLEIIQGSNGQMVKCIPLFEPIETEVFRPSRKKIDLPGFACDLVGLKLADTHLFIEDVKGHRPRYDWKPVSQDVLKFRIEDHDHVEIRIVPRTPNRNNDGEGGIPIDVVEVRRNCPSLDQLARLTQTPASQVDQKVEAGTKATNMARSDMTKIRRQIIRNNNTIRKSNTAIDVLRKQAITAKGKSASNISSQISKHQSTISRCRSANRDLQPQLSRAEKRYNEYSGKLKAFKNYKILLDKPAIIYNDEPMTFTIRLPHPDDRDRKLTLLSMKRPDLSHERDSVLPVLSEEDDDPLNDEEDDDEEEEETMDTEEEEPSPKKTPQRSFLEIT